jgi:hypothetical protein
MSRGDGLVIAPAEETLIRAGDPARAVLLGTDASTEEAPF